MPNNGFHERLVLEAQAQRQELVAQLLPRHLSLRGMQKQLTSMNCINDKTGQPWSHEVLRHDCTALREQWRANAAATAAEHHAAHLAELRAVRATAWQRTQPKLDIILRSLEQEAKLLGLNAPAQVDLTVRVKAMARALGIDEVEAVAAAEEVIREAAQAG